MVTGAGMSLGAKVGVLVAVAVAEGDNQSAERKSDAGTLSFAKVTVLARNDVGDGRGCAEAWDALREAVNDRASERRHHHHHRPLENEGEDERRHGEDLALVSGGSGGCGSADDIIVVCVCVCGLVGGWVGGWWWRKSCESRGSSAQCLLTSLASGRQAGKQPGSHFTVHVSREQ
jgi:hypothetical protein